MENKGPKKSGPSEEEIIGEAFEQEASSRVGLGDTIKKVFTAGLGAAFMTEESIRSYVSELKLPKDVLNMLLQNANRSKEDLINRAGNELTRMLSRIDLVKEASRFVEEHKFRVSAEIEVLKKGGVSQEEKTSESDSESDDEREEAPPV